MANLGAASELPDILIGDASDDDIDLTSYGGGIIRLEDTRVDDLGAEGFVFHEPPVDMAQIDGM